MQNVCREFYRTTAIFTSAGFLCVLGFVEALVNNLGNGGSLLHGEVATRQDTLFLISSEYSSTYICRERGNSSWLLV